MSLLFRIFMGGLCMVGCPLVMWAQVTPADSFIVSSLKFTPDVSAARTHGIQLEFSLEYRGAKAKVLDYVVGFYLTGPDGGLVSSTASGDFFKDDNGNLRVLHSGGLAKDPVRRSNHSLTIPYAALRLGPGEHTLGLQVRLRRGLGNKFEPLPTRFQGDEKFTFEMPEIIKLRLTVAECVVEATNLDGKEWDKTLGSNSTAGAPDLRYRLELESLQASDPLYTSATVENVTQAGWIQPSADFYLGQDDELTLIIEDHDPPTGADRIGQRTFTLEELEKMAAEKTPITFDRVKALVIGGVQRLTY